MTSGLSGRVRSRADRLLDHAQALEEDCRVRVDELLMAIKARSGCALGELHLELQLGGNGDGMLIIETRSGHVFPVAD